MARRRARPRYALDRSEMLSLSDRGKRLGALRAGLATVIVASGMLWPNIWLVTPVWMVAATGVYLCISTGLLALSARHRSISLTALRGGLLLDGIFLAAMIGLTGGASSPLRFLLGIHVVGATLLCSYRTGLKVTLWDTLLFLLVVQAFDADLLPGSGEVAEPASATALMIVAIWLLALGTAWFAAASEGELRRQKAGLADLSAMVARIDALDRSDHAPGAIAGIVLDQVRETFDFKRGVVLASPEGELEALVSTETVPRPPIVGLDPLMSRAWSERTPQLVRRIDPASDPRLATLFPSAENVMVVPLFLVGGHRLGILALEGRRGEGTMRRWDVDMVKQFAAHAALALYNAWLTEERVAQLDTIRGLERRLRAHNSELEVRVAERTDELRAVIRDLEAIDAQRRNLLDHVVRAAEDERRRIAHDVHDDPVQKMVAVKMRLEMLSARLPGLAEIPEALRTVTSAMSSLRRMLFDLSPPILEEEGIGSAVRYFLENSPNAFRWTVDDGLERRPSARSRLILYRTAQEALTNARKHANATNVRVKLGDRDGGLWMQIEDDGVGFEPQDAVVAAPGHLGLAAIRERAEMAGGWCALRSLPGAGTSLEVWLPADSRPPNDLERSHEEDEGEGLGTVLPLQHRIA
jgi:signal transduction histidine kinase